MPGARLMRRQRPGDGVKGEIIIPVVRTTAGGGYVQRQHELAALAVVVQQRRCDHVRSRLLRRFRRAGQADDRGAVGER